MVGLALLIAVSAGIIFFMAKEDGEDRAEEVEAGEEASPPTMAERLRDKMVSAASVVKAMFTRK